MAPMVFQMKWAIIGATIVPVYSNSYVTSILTETTFSTGIIPASNAPPCIAENKIVVQTVATVTLYFCFHN